MSCLNCKKNKDLVDSKQLKCNCKKNENERKRIKNINEEKNKMEFDRTIYNICNNKSCKIIFEKFQTKLGLDSLKCPDHYELNKIYSQRQETKRIQKRQENKEVITEVSSQTKDTEPKDPNNENFSQTKINHKQCNYRNCKVVFENYKTKNGKNGTKCPKHYEMSQRYNVSYDTKRPDRQK